ncbi:ABC-type phosphate transport system substrate-binding protein [Kribbella sp. VKM Ac-2527]|uniref:ABC-type phosphate transport system substrate-binding protein n=1 Tax=Kribbella caucasensis TaxID=2512215 RepID=A0A4R6KAJ5_9ACTN|nr:substrate-binding domain-containing protein [Kribbella sp. VKM Ac-2527]TDO46316.1 ABC-type phosphate transport system substrate-binding protein [Kribbella sp. VKM Ac-2527]
MRFTRTVRATAVAAAAVAMVATSALSASADAPFTPDADDVVIVGSDTTEFVLNDLSALYNSRTPTPTRRMASFDATGPSPITIRPGVSITRPNGSSAGINALCSRTDIDSARSSRPRGASDCADATFLQYAKDQLRWMANDDVTGVGSLTDAQLTSIYNCNLTNWSQLGGPNLAIVPLIPQPNSGTRNFFAGLVGISSSTPPSCVKDTVNGSLVQEHDPAPVAATAGSIAPVSTGRYNLLTPAQQAGTVLGAIPTPDSNAYDRTLFQVVKAPGGAGNVPAYLADLFGDGFGFSSDGGTPYICEPSDTDPATTTAGDIIKANGFLELPAGDCGVEVP